MPTYTIELTDEQDRVLTDMITLEYEQRIGNMRVSEARNAPPKPTNQEMITRLIADFVNQRLAQQRAQLVQQKQEMFARYFRLTKEQQAEVEQLLAKREDPPKK